MAMKFTTRTEYGLICLLYMARNAGERPVTVREIVKDENYSVTYIEKIMQKLRAAKIVLAHHGSRGGYILARPASKIYLKEIVEALEGSTFEIYCEPKLRQSIVCTHFSLCSLMPVWQRTKDLLDHFYESLTLEMIANQTVPAAQLEMVQEKLPYPHDASHLVREQKKVASRTG